MEPRTLTYRKPWLFRAASFLSSLAVFSFPLLAVPEMTAHKPPDYSALPILILVFWGGSLLSLHLSGPDDIAFDLEQKTYRYVKGWPFSPKTRTGIMKDFWGVYVGRRQGGNRYFWVGVTWWGGRDSVTLERFGNKEAAERFAESLMSNLELKQVMPPRNLRPST